MDRTVIKDLLLRGIVGVNEWERHTPQDILVNIVIHTDMHEAARTDRIEDALDYSVVVKEVAEHVEGSRHFLIETLANEIARICLRSPRALRAIVRVEKPAAVRFAKAAGVEIERDRAEFA